MVRLSGHPPSSAPDAVNWLCLRAWRRLPSARPMRARPVPAGSWSVCSRRWTPMATARSARPKAEAAAEKMFDRRDAQRRRRSDRVRVHGPGGWKATRGRPSGRSSTPAAPSAFAAMDKDGDGQVSAQEFFAAAQQRFHGRRRQRRRPRHEGGAALAEGRALASAAALATRFVVTPLSRGDKLK